MSSEIVQLLVINFIAIYCKGVIFNFNTVIMVTLKLNLVKVVSIDSLLTLLLSCSQEFDTNVRAGIKDEL